MVRSNQAMRPGPTSAFLAAARSCPVTRPRTTVTTQIAFRIAFLMDRIMSQKSRPRTILQNYLQTPSRFAFMCETRTERLPLAVNVYVVSPSKVSPWYFVVVALPPSPHAIVSDTVSPLTS